MSGIDKIKNKAEELGGQGKEHAGRATGNESLEAEGHRRPGQGQPQAGRREGQGRLQVVPQHIAAGSFGARPSCCPGSPTAAGVEPCTPVRAAPRPRGGLRGTV